MKKLLILLLLLFTSCEEKKDGEISKFVGTWVVTEMGTYQVATCSGEVDDTEWRGLKGKGLTITLQIYKDGTGKEVITGPEPSTTILTWYDIGETFCFGGDCYNYCLLAAGHIDLVIEGSLMPWDIQALIPIVEAAGGIITSWNGQPVSNHGWVVAAGDSQIHAEAITLLSNCQGV